LNLNLTAHVRGTLKLAVAAHPIHILLISNDTCSSHFDKTASRESNEDVATL
jgi:hypothetical protein